MIDYFTATREEVFFMAIRNRMHLSTIAIKERSVALFSAVSYRSDFTCTIKGSFFITFSVRMCVCVCVWMWVCARMLTGEPWQRNMKLVLRKSWLKLRACSLSCQLDGEYYRYVLGLYDSCLLLDDASASLCFITDSALGSHIVLHIKVFCFFLLKQTIMLQDIQIYETSLRRSFLTMNVSERHISTFFKYTAIRLHR